MKFTTVLSASLLSASVLAAPNTLLPRKNIPIDFASCVTKGVDQIRRAHKDATFRGADFTSAHFSVVQHVLALDVLELTFDSQEAGGVIVLKTAQNALDGLNPSDSQGCKFEPERLVPGHTLSGARIEWVSDVSVGIVAADEVLLKTNTWQPFKGVKLEKASAGAQTTYTFDMKDGKKVKVGAKDGKLVTA